MYFCHRFYRYKLHTHSQTYTDIIKSGKRGKSEKFMLIYTRQHDVIFSYDLYIFHHGFAMLVSHRCLKSLYCTQMPG